MYADQAGPRRGSGSDPLSLDMVARIAEDSSAEAAFPFLRVALNYLEKAAAGAGAVSTSLRPEELLQRFSEPLPTGARSLAQVAARLERDLVADCNRLSHPMAMGHQVSAPLPAAIWAEAVIAALNQSGSVWEMAPTGNAVELQVLRWMAELAGFGAGAGGTFTSGGTEANFAALLAARSRAVPDVWTNGLGSNPPVVVCGEDAHYSVARAAGEMGLGQRNVVTVPSVHFRMDCSALARTLAELETCGRRVMAVVATAGSTATGAFDDLEAVADLCESRDLWLHVDGAHGASALLSAEHRHRLRGLGRAHSLSWDPHKMFLLPLAAGVVLVREERWLEAAFAQAAPYLFERGDETAAGGRPEQEEDERPGKWDQGRRSFLCSRRLDAIKVWVALQRYGADGLGALFDQLCARASALHAELARRPDFQLLHEPECNILCFRYVGSEGAGGNPLLLDRLNARLRAEYNRSGAGWITTALIEDRRVLRVAIMNPRTAPHHLVALVQGLARMGSELETVIRGEMEADARRGREER